jgi:hypothetical protein
MPIASGRAAARARRNRPACPELLAQRAEAREVGIEPCWPLRGMRLELMWKCSKPDESRKSAGLGTSFMLRARRLIGKSLNRRFAYQRGARFRL